MKIGKNKKSKIEIDFFNGQYGKGVLKVFMGFPLVLQTILY